MLFWIGSLMTIHNDILEHHYKAHRRRLVKIVMRRVGRCPYLAEEAVQEAYTRALKYIHCYDPEKTLDNWFHTILNNAVRDLMKVERQRGLGLDNADEVADPIDTDTRVYARSIIDSIFLVKNNLHKEVLELYIIKGLGYKDIVQVTEAHSEAMVRKVVSRFKESLKDE